MKKILSILIFGLFIFQFNSLKSQTSGTLEIKIDTTTSFQEISNFVNQLDSTSTLTFWALSHPKLNDTGVDWKVTMKNNKIMYRLWWHEWLSPWTQISLKSLIETIQKNSLHTNDLTISPK